MNYVNASTRDVKNFIRQPYAWPGGYPLFALCIDGGCLCKSCTKDNAKQIIRATRDTSDRSGWRVVAVAINWEDADLTCDNCSQPIESAYGE